MSLQRFSWRGQLYEGWNPADIHDALLSSGGRDVAGRL